MNRSYSLIKTTQISSICVWCRCMDEPDTRASLLAEEIADQPQAWRRAIEIGSGEPNPLAAPGRVALIGCGSSWHAAKAIAALREAGGIGESDAFAASEAP